MLEDKYIKVHRRKYCGRIIENYQRVLKGGIEKK